jgi:2-C-methyl-D-erythritol 2,4-cyclodiphosphate synthase
MRIGLGIDAHAFDAGVPLVLGGVEFPGEHGLAGHSDGDVLTHALIDALLGAASLGDIGTLFPPDDEAFSGISSLLLLRRAYSRVREAGYELVNADCILVGERPRIADRREALRNRLAEALGADPQQISVRATTTDRLGFTGRGEGLAAQVVALLRQAD